MTEERVVVGLQPVREAIRVHGAALHRVLVAKTGGPRVGGLARFARDQGIEVVEMPKARIDKLSRGVHHQGVLAMAPPLALLDILEAEIAPDALFVMLEGITDPQNFGAIIRGVVALGGSGVIWGEHRAAPLSLSTFRASAGAVEHARLYQTASLRTALGALAERDVLTVALDAEAEQTLADVDLTGAVTLVVGSEDRGVTRGVRHACTTSARLPMSGPIDSLNASVASAIAVYEVIRQRASR
jgi:23S rRNA (guanosine2251-2'-O)-methyltransferase